MRVVVDTNVIVSAAFNASCRRGPAFTTFSLLPDESNNP
jgi:predicted nucleic acid-binding protein